MQPTQKQSEISNKREKIEYNFVVLLKFKAVNLVKELFHFMFDFENEQVFGSFELKENIFRLQTNFVTTRK